MMRLLTFSDLHLEQNPDWSIPATFPAYDVAIVVGDVAGSPIDSVRTLLRASGLAGQPTIFVAGNHEFYHHDLDFSTGLGRAAALASSVYYLERRSLLIDDVTFIGATLWTDHKLGDPRRAAHLMNDYRLIDGFDIAECIRRHQRDLAALDDMLSQPRGKTVVVTHHCPHPGSISAIYANDPCNGAFASDLTWLIEKHKPDLWVHGHTHTSFDYRVGATRIVCNPKGYGPFRGRSPIENSRFDPNLIVIV